MGYCTWKKLGYDPISRKRWRRYSCKDTEVHSTSRIWHFHDSCLVFDEPRPLKNSPYRDLSRNVPVSDAWNTLLNTLKFKKKICICFWSFFVYSTIHLSSKLVIFTIWASGPCIFENSEGKVLDYRNILFWKHKINKALFTCLSTPDWYQKWYHLSFFRDFYLS